MDIDVAPDFPKATYLAVEQHVSAYLTAKRVVSPYTGGWDGLILRFRAADEDGVAAAALLAGSTTLTDDERYSPERSLFGFFVNATSAVECCCFAIYHLGRMVLPSSFNAPEHGINVNTTATAVKMALPCTPLDRALSALLRDPNWRSVRSARNMLVHSASPRKWTGRGIVLEPALVTGPRTWLGQAVTGLVDATFGFVTTNLQ